MNTLAQTKNENIMFTWNTKKVSNGFVSLVFKDTINDKPNKKGSYVDSELVEEYKKVFSSRAKATRYAKKCKMYLKRTHN